MSSNESFPIILLFYYFITCEPLLPMCIGIIKGVKYFNCPDGRGVMMNAEVVTRLD